MGGCHSEPNTQIHQNNSPTYTSNKPKDQIKQKDQQLDNQRSQSSQIEQEKTNIPKLMMNGKINIAYLEPCNNEVAQKIDLCLQKVQKNVHGIYEYYHVFMLVHFSNAIFQISLEKGDEKVNFVLINQKEIKEVQKLLNGTLEQIESEQIQQGHQISFKQIYDICQAYTLQVNEKNQINGFSCFKFPIKILKALKLQNLKGTIRNWKEQNRKCSSNLAQVS